MLPFPSNSGETYNRRIKVQAGPGQKSKTLPPTTAKMAGGMAQVVEYL
jgi:hypothetical protein